MSLVALLAVLYFYKDTFFIFIFLRLHHLSSYILFLFFMLYIYMIRIGMYSYLNKMYIFAHPAIYECTYLFSIKIKDDEAKKSVCEIMKKM